MELVAGAIIVLVVVLAWVYAFLRWRKKGR